MIYLHQKVGEKMRICKYQYLHELVRCYPALLSNGIIVYHTANSSVSDWCNVQRGCRSIEFVENNN